ncbi:putative acyltransferase family protein [Candidatus Competibacter denitrificans Run_A_D11]|uniref:Acyltransferase family protein n=1 Tax=Candidatus Competibacter denitrificans Run_A_D11 TaxID=1400863 RepID=W6MBW5_9GAMM|nr:MFS transporter [Candidatus Competibacter denitrificans]CDI03715.1 putative acyltransferase family protein [Candidatus Competibacter denitrificans Run_A_D11]HRC68393.1 MFS transporter [Candidatus Competibacter denitrificans]
MAHDNEFTLMKERRFLPFFITQFLGAFNDNVFKNALIILIAFQVAATDSARANLLINLCSGLFVLPFFLFSATAGQLSDKYEKSRYIRWVKALEIGIMCGAAAGFLLNSVALLLAMLFMMGFHSTLFGPVKYSILPQHLKPQELVGGNAWIEMGTNMAILLGTMLGGILIAWRNGPLWVSVAVILIAVCGFLSSLTIPQAPPAAPNLKINWNPVTETWRILQLTRQNFTVFQSVLGISWFWFLGSVYLAQLPNFTKLTLGGSEHVVTLLLTLFAVGIGIGSLLCERLSGRMVEIGLVPFGSIGLTVFGIDLFFATPSSPVPSSALLDVGAFLMQPGSWRVLLDIVLIGIFGGIYIVPLYALVQQRSEPTQLSRVIAGNNILNAIFMVAAALIAVVMLHQGLTIPQLLLVMAIFNAAVAIYIFTLVPEFLMRFMVWILVNVVYRLRTEGLDRIPEQGPALVVCNHVSLMDALVVSGCCRRPIRFVMDYQIFKNPLLNFVFRTAGAIPIASARENPEILQRAYQRVADYLRDGEVVGIFPEGRLTPDGEIGPFKSGIERILKQTPVPVVPMALRGLWGSFFSRRYGKAMSGFPRRFWSRIELVVGEAILPEQATSAVLREQVVAMRGDWR